MNSVNESLYFSVPIIMYPKTSEQKGVSERVLQLGAGIKPRKADAKSLITSVKKILSNKFYKENAERIAEGFKNCSGAKGAADKITEVCNIKDPV